MECIRTENEGSGNDDFRKELYTMHSEYGGGWTNSDLIQNKCVCVCVLGRFSHVLFFAILWTVACQVPVFMGFSKQEYWSELPCPPPRDLPNPGKDSMSLMSPILADVILPLASSGKPNRGYNILE